MGVASWELWPTRHVAPYCWIKGHVGAGWGNPAEGKGLERAREGGAIRDELPSVPATQTPQSWGAF